jgi:hypothetical protein
MSTFAVRTLVLNASSTQAVSLQIQTNMPYYTYVILSLRIIPNLFFRILLSFLFSILGRRQ